MTIGKWKMSIEVVRHSVVRFASRHWLLIFISLAIVIGASLPPFMSLGKPQASADVRALENLRAMTRNGALPAEDAVKRIETDYPKTRAAGLARLVRARIHLNAKDFAGGAALLDTTIIRDYTALGDYALLLRGDALEQAGRRAEARTVFEKLAHDYPTSLRAPEALRRAAKLMLQSGDAANVPILLKELIAKDDPEALSLAGVAYQQLQQYDRAKAIYLRLAFYAPASDEGGHAPAVITQLSGLGGPPPPPTAEQYITRAERLYQAKKYADAVTAYSDAFAHFPNTANAQTQLHRGIAAATIRKVSEAVSALSNVPSSAGETRAEALYYLTGTYAHARQWPQAHTTIDEMRRSFPNSQWTPRAMANAGQIADDARNITEATSFFRAAVAAYPGNGDVAGGQFSLAWNAHLAKNYAEASSLLTEHLAAYADKNTDNRGKAGYWAARDSERAGKLAEARALYQAMQGRYDANWYGYLAKQRLDSLTRNGSASGKEFAPDSPVGRAVANLQTVTAAEETAGSDADAQIARADQLTNVGLDDFALAELAAVSAAAPFSPKINLAIARVYRGQEDNVRALNALKKSYPDYSQMKPEELTRDEWDAFYPLAYWEIIRQESRARNLDPFQVAGLIRQETVFNPRAHSSANAYGLMQLLVPTGRLTAQKYGVDRTITADSLYDPRLNIQLGTAYLRDQVDKFGRIEYVAAAYNAGPMRVPQWRASLPAEMDEWAEAVPFKETRGYIQGVVRNRLQYARLYDENGKFKAEVGSNPVNPAASPGAPPNSSPASPSAPSVRKRRVMTDQEE
jgi:soluble lytic murein transglycosylase